MTEFRLKRVYEVPASADGFRVLVDRLWPRGLKRTEADIDLWLKELAPSAALRKWYGHDPEKWPDFRKRYLTELKSGSASLELQELGKGRPHITLLYAAADQERNNAVVLKEFWERQ